MNKTDFFNTLKSLKKKKRASKIEDPKKVPFANDLLRRPVASRVLLSVVLAAVLALLIAPQLTVPQERYRVGDIAKHDIRAPQDFSVEDAQSTQQRRQERAEEVLTVYDFNSNGEEEVERRISTAFAAAREALEKSPAQAPDPEKLKATFQKLLKIRVGDEDFNLLLKRAFKKEIEDYLLELTLPFSQREVIAAKDQLFKERSRGIVLRDIYSQEEIIVDDFSSLIDLKEAHILVKRDARKILKNVRIDVRRTIVDLAEKLIEPTITFNNIETTTRKTKAVQEVSPLYYHVKAGEMIIREGARIDEATLVKIEALVNLKEKRNIGWTLLGYFLFSFVMLLVIHRFATVYLSGDALHKTTPRDFVFLAAVCLLSVLVIKFSVMSAIVFSKGYTALPLESYFFIIPFAFAAIVISVVLSPQIAALSVIVISVFACFVLESRFSFFLYAFVGGLVAAHEVAQSRERKTIIRAGVIVGAMNALLILALYLIAGELFQLTSIAAIVFGLLSGVLSAVVATGIIPIIEIMFNYTTDIKLLELADLNQPVLRKLLIEAPGTYHHSILVGVLAEAAAEAIHANPLLARVSAYYHDIGKMKKPLYFVENQKGGENRHDKLLPSMSTLIITSHVKNGVDIGRQYRLGKTILDIISQHHGTSRAQYFYQKAKDMRESLKQQPVSDEGFRYPGPKPQTKEAGIVMLADAVQATSKTLSVPTPARIQGMVQRIINNIFVDGQLDECELTLKDLHLIAENFIRILNGIFHSRIEYPDAEKETNGKDLDKKPAKPDNDRPLSDQADSERDLGKRIGLTKSRNKHSATG